jgi:hypothetical protein
MTSYLPLLLIAGALVSIALLSYGAAKSLWGRGGIQRLLAVLCFLMIAVIEVLPFFVQSNHSPEFPVFLVAWGLGMHLLLVVSVAAWVMA